MKNNNKVFITFSILISLLTFTSCKKEGCTDPNAQNYESAADEDDGSCVFCSSKGTLRLSNTSVNTTQKVIIDGANYGFLYPGDTKDYSLAPGSHTFITDGVANGDGCDTPVTVIIIECETEGFNCSG